MHPAYQPLPAPSDLPLLSSKEVKVIMQRQYREKEGGCITTLRDVIKGLTGQELQTRQEILRKAIDLLFAISEIKRQREAQAIPPIPPETLYLADAAHSGSLTQSFHELQTCHFNAEFNTPQFTAPNAWYPDPVSASGMGSTSVERLVLADGPEQSCTVLDSQSYYLNQAFSSHMPAATCNLFPA